LVSIVLYGFYLCFAAFVIYVGYDLSRRFPYRFLKNFLYYLVFYYINGFIFFIGVTFNVLLFLPSLESFQMAAQLILLLAMPAEIFFLFFLILWVSELLDRRLPRWAGWVYFSVQIGFFLRVMLRAKRLFDTHDVKLSGPTTQMQTVGAIIFCAALVYLIFGGGRDLSVRRKALARRMGIFSLLGYTIFLAFTEKFDLPFYSNFTLMLLSMALLHSAVNLAPVLVLRRFLGRYPRELGGEKPETSRVLDFYDKYHLTQREREIIELIMSGKDTKEIARALFISTKTVKNNVSNIFQKTHAKSRIQLLSFISNWSPPLGSDQRK